MHALPDLYRSTSVVPLALRLLPAQFRAGCRLRRRRRAFGARRCPLYIGLGSILAAESPSVRTILADFRATLSLCLVTALGCDADLREPCLLNVPDGEFGGAGYEIILPNDWGNCVRRLGDIPPNSVRALRGKAPPGPRGVVISFAYVFTFVRFVFCMSDFFFVVAKIGRFGRGVLTIYGEVIYKLYDCCAFQIVGVEELY